LFECARLSDKDEIEVIIYRIAPSLAGFIETRVTQKVEDQELYISGYACERGNSETSRTGRVLLYIKE